MGALPKVGSVATLFQEAIASDHAISGLIKNDDTEEVKSAYKFLIPAFASYCAAAVIPVSATIQLVNEMGACQTKSCMAQAAGALKSQAIA